MKTSFEEVWAQVQGLPEAAKEQIPDVLSNFTKKRLSELSPKQIEGIVNTAIETVNKGSIETIDSLIQKLL